MRLTGNKFMLHQVRASGLYHTRHLTQCPVPYSTRSCTSWGQREHGCPDPPAPLQLSRHDTCQWSNKEATPFAISTSSHMEWNAGIASAAHSHYSCTSFSPSIDIMAVGSASSRRPRAWAPPCLLPLANGTAMDALSVRLTYLALCIIHRVPACV
jgi:hypothetical protein